MSGTHPEVLNRIEITFVEYGKHDEKVLLSQIGILEKAFFSGDWQWLEIGLERKTKL